MEFSKYIRGQLRLIKAIWGQPGLFNPIVLMLIKVYKSQSGTIWVNKINQGQYGPIRINGSQLRSIRFNWLHFNSIVLFKFKVVHYFRHSYSMYLCCPPWPCPCCPQFPPCLPSPTCPSEVSTSNFK